MIGLSGLITPSLEEMQHVAREMQRQQFSLRCDRGATNEPRAHSGQDRAHYTRGPVIHVVDASRSVAVCQSLVSDDGAQSFADIKSEYQRVREQHAAKRGPD